MQRTTCILGSSNNIPDQSKQQHGFSQPRFPRGRCWLPFLFRMTKGHCFVVVVVPGLTTQHCITVDSEMVVSFLHSTLKETQDVTTEVAADPHPPRSHHCMPLGSQVSRTKAIQMGCSALGMCLQGSSTCPYLDMELRISPAPPRPLLPLQQL